MIVASLMHKSTKEIRRAIRRAKRIYVKVPCRDRTVSMCITKAEADYQLREQMTEGEPQLEWTTIGAQMFITPRS